MENNGMALGIAGDAPLLGIAGLNLDDIPVIHPELHKRLQPVFEIMEQDFPGFRMIVESGSAKITKEEIHGVIFYEKRLEEFKSEIMQNMITALYSAAEPIIQDFINDIKKE